MADSPSTVPSPAAPLDADAFLDAAQRVDQGQNQFCCTALKQVQDRRNGTPEYHLFESLFKPKDTSWLLPWWSSDDSDRKTRVIALLLCYWMAKGGAK